MIFLKDQQETEAFGAKLASAFETGMNIYLYGDLGAGKTTLVRGLVQKFIPGAKVKSPTYTLVEDYHPESLPGVNHIYHFDLYRMADPEELEYLGGRDYFSQDAVCLVEWPQRGEGWLAAADIELTLHYLPDGRNVELKANTEIGRELIKKVANSSE